MREIKFRAWDKEFGGMYMVTTLQFHACGQINAWPFYPDAVKPEARSYGHNPILMQYTGLKDRNGKEIYEGDIIVWYINDMRPMAPVLFEYGAFWMGIDISVEHNVGSVCNDWLRGEYEVKGNIYETPELLDNWIEKQNL